MKNQGYMTASARIKFDARSAGSKNLKHPSALL
jgi:hypothetical protein